MPHTNSGSRQWLSASRSLVIDGCYFAKAIPFYPVERHCELSEVAHLRKSAKTRISWTALFLKAYARVAVELPVLRQCYVSFPWPHIFQHAHNVGMLAMNRHFSGEDRLCWGRFEQPEDRPLVDIQLALDRYQSEPVDQIFRRQVFLSRLPWPIRRIAWWLNLNLFLSKRAKRLGTFSMSTLAGQGAFNRLHFTVLSNTLSYGPLDESGRSLVTLICDHRVIDGSLAAEALIRLEGHFHGAISVELQSLADARAA